MAMNVQQRGAKFQLRVKHALLPKPFFFTFDTEDEATSYGTQLEAVLARGVVPSELLAAKPKREDDPLVTQIISEYAATAPITDSDDQLLDTIEGEVAGLRFSGLTMKWVETYLAKLKVDLNLAPGTVRKRIGCLARVVDWHLRRSHSGQQAMPANVLRLLPRGYSLYTKSEAERVVEKEGKAKSDVSRDYRLEPEAEVKVRAALSGEKRPDRERALPVDPEFTMLFDLILDTGMRLSEGYRLRDDQIDLGRRVIRVEGSKGHRGEIKPRVVPIKAALLAKLTTYLDGRAPGLLFSFWDGTDEGRPGASSRLSQRFKTLFTYAGQPHLTEHDLRHEATCRWFELRRGDGAWAFSDIEVCRIMGWTNTNLALRYASLRGEDLAARLDF